MNKKIIMFILALCVANLAYAQDAGWIGTDKAGYDKWFNKGDGILVSTASTIICNNKDTLAKLYNYLSQTGGSYSVQSIESNWDGCTVPLRQYPVKIVKTFYDGKIDQIEYATGNSDGSYTIFKNDKYNKQFVLRAQILSAKQYQERMLINDDRDK